MVTDSQGHPVQGALVYQVGLPYGWVKGSQEEATGADGSVTLTVAPTARLPVGGKNALVMFVRARKPGGSLLAGVSTGGSSRSAFARSAGPQRRGPPLRPCAAASARAV